MSKGSGKGRKKTKPAKKHRPLTSSKKVVESNKKLFDHFNEVVKKMAKQIDEKLSGMAKIVGDVNATAKQLWQNQQVQQQGLSVAEHHAMLTRRVLNDALGGVTRVTTIKRKVEAGKDEMEEVQVIDWDWYSEQLDFCDDTHEFMAGVVMPDESVQIKAEARKVELEKKNEEIFKKNLEGLDKATTAMLKKHADDFRPLLEDDKQFRRKVESIYGNLSEKLFEAACAMIRTKLENAPSQEEMEEEAKALQEKLKRVTEEAAKRERGEPYDEELLAEADAEIAKMEAEEAENPHPEGAAIFGGS